MKWVESPNGRVVLLSSIILTRVWQATGPPVGFVETWNIAKIESGTWWANTPPLHAFLASGADTVFGYRLLSLLPWLGVAFLLRGRGRLAWLAMPMSYQWAAKVSPDMLTVLLVVLVWKYGSRYFPFLILTKPLGVFAIPALILEKRYQSAIMCITFCTIVIGLPPVLDLIALHNRGIGYWHWSNLSLLLMGTGALILCVRNWNAWILGFGCFYLYAAPAWHGYYQLPMLPFIAMQYDRPIWLLWFVWLTGLYAGIATQFLPLP